MMISVSMMIFFFKRAFNIHQPQTKPSPNQFDIIFMFYFHFSMNRMDGLSSSVSM